LPHVTSSAITEVVHDPATATLAIRFASGEAYAYRGVSAEVYAGLLAAPSNGAFFQALSVRAPLARRGVSDHSGGGGAGAVRA
jgi:hypothetical protein